MSLFLSELGFYPQFLFAPADDESGAGGSGGDGGEGDDNSGGGDDGDNGSGDDGGDDGDNKSGGLIDKNKVMGKKSGEGDEQDPDKKQGEGDEKAERPEFIPEKFWDAEKGEPRLESMAKAYGDLEKKLGSKGKAPDEYKVEISDDLKSIFHEENADKDPMLAWFKDYAKANNFTQEQFNEALEGFGKSATEFLKESAISPPDPKEELGKLGKNGQAIVDNQVEFLSGLFKRGELNEDQMQEILILTETAAGVKALQAIRSHYGEKQNIPMNLNPGGGIKSADELRAMQADKKYGTDPEYTKMVDAEYEKKYGTGNSGESQRSAL